MISVDRSALVYFRRLGLVRNAIARFARVKAGDPADCGHERRGGEFARGNECAGEGGERDWDRSLRSYEERGMTEDQARELYEEFGTADVKAIRQHREGAEQSQYGVMGHDIPDEYKDAYEILSPNEKALLRSPKKRALFGKLANQAVKNEPGYLPTVQELIAMAQIGRSAKGQYEAAANLMTQSFGEPATRHWAAMNAIMSPNTPAPVHTFVSVRLMKNWFEAGMPSGNSPEALGKIDQIITRVQEQEIPGYRNAGLAIDGVRKRKLAKLLSKYGESITDDMIATYGRKAIEFGGSFFDPKRVAIDAWMSALTNPEAIFPRLKKMDPTTDKARNMVKEARAKALDNPEKYMAYKVAVTRAADALGWEPRQVQEAVWSATMSIALLKAAGIGDERIIPSLTHQLVRESWDMEGMIDASGIQRALIRGGISPGVAGNVAGGPEGSGATRAGEGGGRKKTEPPGRIILSPEARTVAEKVARRIPAASSPTRRGRPIHVPAGPGGWGTRVHHRLVRRPRRFADPRSWLSCNQDETIHSMAQSPPHYLSSEQVGAIIANQYHNRPKHYSPQEMAATWTVSTLFELRPIPTWVATLLQTIRPGTRSHSSGPIIVDLRRRPDKDRHQGSFGHNMKIGVLDGNHRLDEHLRETGDGEIEAFVGTEAMETIDEYIKEFGPKRQSFVEALDGFYSDHNIASWNKLILTGRSLGLSDDQLRLIRSNFLGGLVFSPALGEFVPSRE